MRSLIPILYLSSIVVSLVLSSCTTKNSDSKTIATPENEEDRKGATTTTTDWLAGDKKSDSLVSFEIADSMMFNQFDNNGLKQGKWKIYRNGKLLELEEYKDGKLNGTSTSYDTHGAVTFTREFKNGQEHGYTTVYHQVYSEEYKTAKMVIYFENGVKQWWAFPWDLEENIIPAKGFHLESTIDTVHVKVSYISGSPLYDGVVSRIGGEYGGPKRIGLHKSYYPDGQLRSIVQYDIDSIFLFDEQGQPLEPIHFNSIHSTMTFAEYFNKND